MIGLLAAKIRGNPFHFCLEASENWEKKLDVACSLFFPLDGVTLHHIAGFLMND